MNPTQTLAEQLAALVQIDYATTFTDAIRNLPTPGCLRKSCGFTSGHGGPCSSDPTWQDLPYNFAVNDKGDILELRGFEFRPPAQ